MIELGYRNLEPSDFNALHPIVSDWHVVRQLGSWPYPADADFTKGRCQPFPGHGFVWGVFTDIGLIGTVGVAEGDLGYMLDRRFWDQGVGSRMVTAALDEAFANHGLAQIKASTWFDNPGSARVLEKHGFVVSGRETLHSKARDLPTPVTHFVLTAEVYNSLRDQAE